MGSAGECGCEVLLGIGPAYDEVLGASENGHDEVNRLAAGEALWVKRSGQSSKTRVQHLFCVGLLAGSTQGRTAMARRMERHGLRAWHHGCRRVAPTGLAMDLSVTQRGTSHHSCKPRDHFELTSEVMS